MHAEIITSGTELLLGEIVDTNSNYIARALREIGLDLLYIVSVGDNETRMAGMIEAALVRHAVVIITGGLGPTVDDITRQAVARATGRELELLPELVHDIEAFFARTGRPMTDNNRRQAYVPAGAIPIHNPVGTAPAFIIEDRLGTVICLPGVPREMEYLMQHEVLPYLRRALGLTHIIRTRILRTCAIGESQVDHLIGDLEKLTNPTVGLAVHPGQTDVRITAKAESEVEVERMLAGIEAQVRERLGDVIFGVDKQTLEEVVALLVARRDRTLALVETNTEGKIAGRLRKALDTLDEGRRLRGAETVSPDSVVLEPDAVLCQAREVAAATGADSVLFVAGTAGDGQGVYQAEPGSTLIALITPGYEGVRRFHYGGRDPLTQTWITFRALDLLRREMAGLSLDFAY